MTAGGVVHRMFKYVRDTQAGQPSGGVVRVGHGDGVCVFGQDGLFGDVIVEIIGVLCQCAACASLRQGCRSSQGITGDVQNEPGIVHGAGDLPLRVVLKTGDVRHACRRVNHGRGTDLPGSVIRVYQAGQRGAAAFIVQGALCDVPQSVDLGSAPS